MQLDWNLQGKTTALMNSVIEVVVLSFLGPAEFLGGEYFQKHFHQRHQ